MNRWGGSVLVALAMSCLACSDAPEEPVAVVTHEPSVLTLSHGSVVQSTLRWQLLSGFPTDQDGLFVFVHLLNAAGEVVLTADHRFPPSEGDTFDHPLALYHSALAPPLRSGTYRLTVGLYRPKGERLPLRGEDIGRQEYAVAEVTVPSAVDTPTFQFSQAWTSPVEGADRQVRALRWMTGPGTISYDGVGDGERLLLELRLPKPAEGKQLLFEEGFDEPFVEVTACDGFQQTLRGFGSYRLEIPVSGPCEVALTSSFNWVDVKTFVRSSLVLEQVGLLAN